MGDQGIDGRKGQKVLLSVYLFVHPSVCLSVCLSVHHTKSYHSCKTSMKTLQGESGVGLPGPPGINGISNATKGDKVTSIYLIVWDITHLTIFIPLG